MKNLDKFLVIWDWIIFHSLMNSSMPPFNPIWLWYYSIYYTCWYLFRYFMYFLDCFIPNINSLFKSCYSCNHIRCNVIPINTFHIVLSNSHIYQLSPLFKDFIKILGSLSKLLSKFLSNFFIILGHLHCNINTKILNFVYHLILSFFNY
jgi:hypothetical protein